MVFILEFKEAEGLEENNLAQFIIGELRLRPLRLSLNFYMSSDVSSSEIMVRGRIEYSPTALFGTDIEN